MHANFFLLALTAVGAMAVPAKRAVVTDMDVVTTVVYVTETAGAPVTTKENNHPVVIVTKTINQQQYGPPSGFPHRHHHHSPKYSKKHSSSTEEPETTTPIVYTTAAPTTTLTPSVYSTTKEKPSKTHTTQNPNPTEPLGHYAATVIRHHNVHRFNHSASAIGWSQDLADTAMKIADSCYYAHNTDMDGGGYGQNIAAGTPANNISSVITDGFYNGEVWQFDGLYGEANPPNFESWGHFSQIVWKDTTHVGCATKHCTSGLSSDIDMTDIPPYFTVCNYKAVGNMAGEYGTQIGEPLGHPTVEWSY